MLIKSPAIRYHGGKFRVAPWILSYFPNHRYYVEPFGGAAGVLLQKARAYAEVYNDLDSGVVNFFRVLQSHDSRQQLIEKLTLTPYARSEFELAWQPVNDPIERARRLCIRAQMGFGSAGATKGTTGFRTDIKRNCANAQHKWAIYPETIASVGERLTGVLIENRPALDVLQQFDDPDTLFFVDPPYVHETRSIGENSYYQHEMTDEDHIALLERLNQINGMVVLSGYDCLLYREYLSHWTVVQKQVAGSSCTGSVKRIETLWLNPLCQNRQRITQAHLFG